MTKRDRDPMRLDAREEMRPMRVRMELPRRRTETGVMRNRWPVTAEKTIAVNQSKVAGQRTQRRQQIHSLSLVVPFYNEEETIELLHQRLMPVLKELQRTARVQLVLVDDGSTDGTFERLHQWFGRQAFGHCEILQHPINRGIGAAMRTGFRAATGEIVCTMDCDCSYDPGALIGMVRRLRESHADVVTASPYHPAVLDGPASRRLWLSRACSLLYGGLAPVNLYCYTSFFRAYRREWTRGDLFVSDGFLGVTEILLAAAFCGAAIEEYPVPLGVRRYGRSKMRSFEVIREHLALMGQTVLLNTRLRLGRIWARAEEAPLYAIGKDLEPPLSRLDFMGRLKFGPTGVDPNPNALKVEHAEAYS